MAIRFIIYSVLIICKHWRYILKDLTTGSLKTHLFELALPTIGGMIAFSLFNITDTYFVGKLGTDALAAMGFTFPIVMMAGAISTGISTGAASLLSRAYGNGDRHKMQRIATDGILLSIILVSIFSLIGLLTIDPLFKFMGADPHTLPLIKSFMTIWYGAVIVVMIPPVSDGAMRAIGDTVRPFKVMLTCALFNLVLDPIFIFGWFGIPAMGIQGAAIATVLSRCIGMWVSLYYNFRVHKLISIEKFQVSEVLASWKQIIQLGIPSAGVVMLPQVIRICLTSLAAYTGGTETVASVAIGSRIESFSLIIAMSIGSCIVPLVGQNYGAKKYDRVSDIQKMLSKVALVASGLILVGVVTLSTPLIKLFSTEFQVIRYTYIYLLVLTIGSIGLNLYNFNTQVLNALGLSKKAFTINSTGTFIVILPLMFLGSTISFTYMLIGLGLGQIILGFYSAFYGKKTTRFDNSELFT